MKKRVLSALVMLLLTSMLFFLTACDEDSNDKEEKKNKSAKTIIEEYVDAINDQDADRVVDLIDIKTLGNWFAENIKSKNLKSRFEDFFDGHEGFKIKIKKIYKINDSNFDELDKDDYDSYDDYIDYMKDQCDVNDIYIYAVKLDYPDDYNEIFDGTNNTDYIFLTKKDGEYKIFYSLYAFYFYYSEMDY